MAHIDAGKTTTTERILYYTGITHKIGEVHEGTATMDWMVQEQERGITITSAATTAMWGDVRINIIDTPVTSIHVEVERVAACSRWSCRCLLRRRWMLSRSRDSVAPGRQVRCPRIAFVNKMDRVGANFNSVVNQIRQKLGKNAVPLKMPIGSEESSRCHRPSSNAALISRRVLGAKYEIAEIPEELRPTPSTFARRWSSRRRAERHTP